MKLLLFVFIQIVFARDMALLEKIQNDICANPTVEVYETEGKSVCLNCSPGTKLPEVPPKSLKAVSKAVKTQDEARAQRDRELAFYQYAESRNFDGLKFDTMYFGSPKVIETQVKVLKSKIVDETQNLEKAKMKINELEAMSDYEKEEWQGVLKDNYRLEKVATAKIEIAKLKIRELEEASQKKTDSQTQEFLDLKHKAYDAFAQNYSDEAMENDGFSNCGMSIAEISAIRWYTATEFSKINSALRTGGMLTEQVEPLRVVLESALKKIKPYTGVVRRGVNLPKEADLAHQPGQTVTYPAYTSTGIFEGFSANHKFIIKSKTGKYVGIYSNVFTEDEVLFSPGAKFKILSREGNEITMEEVAP